MTYRDEQLASIPGWWGPQQDCLFPQAAGIVQSEGITKGITRHTHKKPQ